MEDSCIDGRAMQMQWQTLTDVAWGKKGVFWMKQQP